MLALSKLGVINYGVSKLRYLSVLWFVSGEILFFTFLAVIVPPVQLGCEENQM